MTTLSVAMIVKDEALILERCLACATAFADEVVVVDTGSSDNTVGIARKYGAVVSTFAWVDDFSAARNASFDRATCTWVMWLDADDVIDEVSINRLRDYKRTILCDPNLDALMLPYDVGHQRLLRERLVRRVGRMPWFGPVHESFYVPEGRYAVRDDVVITHAPKPEYGPRKVGRNLRILQRWYEQASSLRPLFQYGFELLDNRRAAEAVPILRQYLLGKKNDNRGGECYWVMLRLIDALCQTGEHKEAQSIGLQAIGLDSSRAEAFCMTGIAYVDGGEPARALPLFIAALAATKPSDAWVVYAEHYDELPRRYLQLCFDKLGKPQSVRVHLSRLGLTLE